MKLREFMEYINLLVEQNPQCLDYEVVYYYEEDDDFYSIDYLPDIIDELQDIIDSKGICINYVELC